MHPEITNYLTLQDIQHDTDTIYTIRVNSAKLKLHEKW